MNKLLSTGRAFLFILTIGLCISSKVFALDNVLQAIQVNGVKDSFNIVLKSDDVAEFKKTVQAPNKIIVDLKGIRASKAINTIYNNTSGIDSVVVEPQGQDAVKIFIQGVNAGNAEVHFDTLKTPLGVLGNPQTKKQPDSIILSEPMNTYKPVYNQIEKKSSDNFSMSKIIASPAAHYAKKALKNEKLSWMITFGLFTIIILSSVRTVKGKDNEIKIGLAQSLKEREIELYKEMIASNTPASIPSGTININPVRPTIAPQQVAGTYGIKAYQQSETRNPYVSSEIQRPRPISTPQVSVPSAIKKPAQRQLQNTNQKTAVKIEQNVMTNTTVKTKVANIDSMKFLESMTRIYEKNGRTDLAQGLKSNMKKAKLNLA